MKNLLLAFFAAAISIVATGQTVQVSPVTSGGFETGNTFSANGWTVVNGTYNNLYVGNTPVPSDGANCAFSGSSPVAWAGTANQSVNHFYRDIAFGTESKLDVSFKYKLSVADAGYDQLKVFLVPTSTTPVAGTQLSSGQIGVIYETATSWTTIALSGISASGLGTTARLVFSWKCDAYSPLAAVAIDYVSVISNSPPPPLSGIYTIDPAGSGPRNFSGFTDAINTLNTAGIGSGGVVFNVAAGAVFIEDAPAIATTGTLSNPIIFQKSGTGANPVIKPTGTSSSQEGAFKFIGCDYITFNGIDVTINTGYALEYGYYFVGLNNSNGCQNNTVTNSTITLNATNTSSYGIYCYSYATSASGTNSNNKFYNNSIANCYSGIAMNGSSNTYDSGNEIGTENGGISSIQLPGTTANVNCIGVNYSYQTGLKIFNTSISMNAAGTWGSAYGIYSFIGSNNTVSIYNNDISGFNATFGGYFASGIYLTSGNTHQIYSNKIHGISNSYAGISASGSSAYGIYITTGTTINVYGNEVYDIFYAGPSAHSANGIYISYGTTISVYNNMIYDIKAPVSTSSSAGACGLYLGGGTTVNAFYNTVLLNYNATGSGANRSAALYVTSSPANVDLRNNIFVNLTNLSGNSNGSSRAFAFLRNTTSLANLSLSCDYNLYYAGNPGTNNLIFHDGVNSDQTLASYKTRVTPRDQHAVTENPPFLSTSDIYNLHINPLVPTQCESNGIRVTTPFAVTNDIDADKRWGEPGYAGGGTAPDLGADEFSGTSIDLDPPVISYTPLSNTGSLLNRTLVATITDVKSGVGAGANQPVLYWKIGGAGYTGPVAPVAVNGNQYTFSFGAGAVFGNVVSYFVIAQDNAPNPNVTSFPIGAVCSINPPTAVSPPPTPRSYTIIGSICGTKTVGTGGDYATISSALSDLNSKELCGPLDLLLTDATYDSGETFPLTILPNPGASAVNLVTIKPAPAISPIIACSSSSSVFNLNGSDYLVIDGSNQTAGTTRDLTILNNYTAGIYNYGISLGHNGSRGATNTVIKNCIIEGNPLYTNCFGIYMNPEGGGYHGTIIQNNCLKNVNTAIVCSGANGNITNNILITGNTIGDQTKPVRVGGITVNYCNQTTITGNEISGEITGNSNYNQTGILLGTGATNSAVRQNRIHDFYYSGTEGWGCFGIKFAGENTSVTEISNNLIYNIKADGWNSGVNYNAAGILVYSGGNLHIWFNTIYLSGNVLSGNFNSFSAGISLNADVTLLDIRNNIIKNSQGQIFGGTSTNKTYAIYSLSASTAFSEINYNDYYPDGSNPNIGYLSTDQVSLAAWQTATGKDASSLSADPQFSSSTNLTPVNNALNGAGVYGTGVVVDFFNLARLNPPDIGAIEFGSSVLPFVNLNNIEISEGGNVCYNATQTITVAGNGTAFSVTSGGSATLIAGQNIVFLPGTNVTEGGYLHGYITTTGNYCENPSNKSVISSTSKETSSNIAGTGNLFSVYPNPTNGRFSLELKDDVDFQYSNVQVYDLTGSLLVNEKMTTNKKEFSLAGKNPGIYMIRVTIGNKTGSAKVVKY